MDPLSITASVVGITTATLQSVQLLLKAIDNVKDAPDTLRGVGVDLQVVQPVLQSLDKALQEGTSQIILSSEVKYAVENCDRACRAFQSQVQRWMKHSTEDKMFWMDRWKIGLFGLERIQTFKAQLSDYKGTLTIALSTAATLAMSRNENLLKEMKDMMLQQNETVVRQQIVQADTEITQIERSMRQLTADRGGELSSLPQQTSESEQSRQELLQELGRQQAANNAFKTMCEEALSTTIHERTGQKIQNVKATNNSSATAGFVNTSGEEEKIKQDISDVYADNGSMAFAGVMKNVDFKDLRPSGADRGSRDAVPRKL